MIPLFFNRLPVSLAQKVELMIKRAIQEYGSEYYNVGKDKFVGDSLTVESIFPDWIVDEYDSDPNSVKIIPIVKNYLRWLFSLKYGYGAYIEWETLRSPFLMPEKLLEGLAEFYFPGENFASDDLKDVLPNIRQFSLQVDTQYFEIKGTPQGIKYVLTTLLGYDYDTTRVNSYSGNIVEVVANVTDSHKAFLERSVLPAGMIVLYSSP